MTEQEAKDMLKAKLKCLELDSDIEGCDGNCNECEYCYTQGTFGEQKEALAMAIKALEKQIPKKPLYAVVSRDDAVHCPICECFVCFRGAKEYNYCPKCGQKLDWSDEE